MLDTRERFGRQIGSSLDGGTIANKNAEAVERLKQLGISVLVRTVLHVGDKKCWRIWSVCSAHESGSEERRAGALTRFWARVIAESRCPADQVHGSRGRSVGGSAARGGR